MLLAFYIYYLNLSARSIESYSCIFNFRANLIQNQKFLLVFI